MTRRARRLLSAALLVATAAIIAPAAAGAVTFSQCPADRGLGCSRVNVPLDHSGTVPGTISLNVERLLAGSSPSTDAVIGLAGGPGQAAAPLTREFQQMIGPALKTRDLVVFDQRGTGRSDPLSCAAVNLPSGSSQALARRCALEIGSKRGFFTTSDSVDDIETLRQDLGYQKLVLFGVSYGTKVAIEYAQRYPQNVEALVLDSTVRVNGPDPLERSTFEAIPGVVTRLCSDGACAHISHHPVAELSQLVKRMTTHPLHGHVFDGSGHKVEMTMGRDDLLDLMVGGDLDPVLRAELPASVHAALGGDPAELLRLSLIAEGLVPDSVDGSALAREARFAAREHAARLPGGARALAASSSQDANGGAFDNALYLDTSCEEEPFPWTPRQASPVKRELQAVSAADALSTLELYPFDRATALTGENIPTCLEWPVRSPAPPAPGPLPDVPTLIVSGAADLRTPTADAEKVAALIPDAQVLVVPNTGHSTIASDPTHCTRNALRAFFANRAVTPCSASRNPYPPTPVAPTRLSLVTAAPGVPGVTGQTLTAVQATLIDLRLELIGAVLNAEAELPPGSRFGGLRGGSAVLTENKSVKLRALSYVPGVTLTGTVPEPLLNHHVGRSATIVVGGRTAARGTVRLAAGNLLIGDLGGHHFRIRLASEASAASAGGAGELYPGTLAPEPGLAQAP